MRTRRNTLRFLTALAVSLAFAVTGRAAEVVVQNDSLANFSQGAIQAGFVAGESAAAWLTSPCDGDIERLQVLWMSFTGGAPDALGEWIKVFDAGTFPEPGTERAELSGPLMQDGFLNEFTLPAPLAVSNGETFVVSFKFLDTPPPTGPSLVTDVDGCQADSNGIFAIPPSAWFDGCSLGISGDFVIRAVVECTTAPVVVTVFPPSGELVRQTHFDLTVIAEVPAGVNLADATVLLDGEDRSAGFQECFIVGSLVPTGVTLRCRGLTGARFGVGTHTLEVELEFDDGSSGSDTVSWEVRETIEP